MKSFFRCTHYLVHQHIPHTTNLEKLVELVVSCGGDDLKHFLDRTGRNAMYTSYIAVVEFIETLGAWVGQSIPKRLCQASRFDIIADECTHVATIKKISVFCQCEE